MKIEIKIDWLEALRSGEYPQARGSLKSAHGYCCLGVLCELAVLAGLDIAVDADPSGRTLYDGSDAYLPHSVRDWAGLSDSNPRVPHQLGSLRTNNLAGYNDGGYTFFEIADLIEKHL